MANTTINTMLRTSSGTIYFDALLHADHNATVTPTQHPVQTGAAISDHAFVDPKEISLDVGMTDVIGGDGSSVRAYQTFLAIMEKREPVTVVTRLGTYQNMLLSSISAPDDYTTMYGLRCTLIFTEIRVVSVATVKVQSQTSGGKTPSSPSPTTSTPATTTPTQTPATQPTTQKPGSTTRQSVLRQATDAAKKTSSTTAAQQKQTGAAGTSIFDSIKKAVSNTVSTVKTAVANVVAKISTTASTSKATTTPSKPVAAKVNKLTSAKANGKSIALLK